MNSPVFGRGNTKLAPCIATFNMTPSASCPSRALGLCSHPGECYARADEYRYPNTVPEYRARQAAFWRVCKLSLPLLKGVDLFVGRLLRETTVNGARARYFRFSVSGDFRSQADVDLMARICATLKRLDISSYGYTARRDLSFLPLKRVATVNGQNHFQNNQFNVVAPGGIPKWAKYVCKGKVPRSTGLSFGPS